MNVTRKFPFEYQLDAMDCGPCLKIITSVQLRVLSGGHSLMLKQPIRNEK